MTDLSRSCNMEKLSHYTLAPLKKSTSFIKILIVKPINQFERDTPLLRKIEELTFYVIELKKENEVQAEMIEELLKSNQIENESN